MDENRIEVVAIKMPHQWWLDNIAQMQDPGPDYGLEATAIASSFVDLIFESPDFVVGKLEVGATVTIKEPPCPMDNCNAHLVSTPPGVIVWLGPEGGYEAPMSDPLVNVWYLLQ